jgi:hypothetical protein
VHTFAAKLKTTQQANLAGSAKASSTLSGQCHDTHLIFQLQRTIGNQAVEKLLRTDSESLERESSTPHLQLTSLLSRQPVIQKTALDPSHREPPPCTTVYCSYADTKEECESCCWSAVPVEDPPHCHDQCRASCASLPPAKSPRRR